MTRGTVGRRRRDAALISSTAAKIGSHFITMPWPPPYGAIVGDGVLARGPVAQVMDADIQEALFPGPLEDALAQRAFADGREEGEDVDAHGGKPRPGVRAPSPAARPATA
jgi:hypothetical protein